jgi:nitroimidazol reductase NimA-like FMN-containing flavoprotein (pyridoxamine 5'-phosphate oxidase superfamily)
MDTAEREKINRFLADYDTLVIATEEGDQPYATRAFFVEKPLDTNDASLDLYGTFIVTSRKLANLKANPRVGLFIGPDKPSAWLEATAIASVVEGEAETAAIKTNLSEKSPAAGEFIARVPVAAVRLSVQWLRITDLAAIPFAMEVSFETNSPDKDPRA